MLDRLIPEKTINALREVVENNDDFVILSHKNPDGDAVGSSLAWMLYLRSLGKKADVVLPNMFPDFLKWLPSASDIVIYDSDKEKAKTMIDAAGAIFCLDFNSLSRIGEMGEYVKPTAKKILIDHHLSPDDGFVVAVSSPKACSTSELVFRLIYRISSLDIMTLDIAKAIYTGMMTDTGSFAYASNRKDIYLIVAELIAKGVDKDSIYRRVFYNYSENRLKLIGYVLHEKLKYFSKKNAALITLDNKEMKRFYMAKGDTEGLVNMPLQIKGVRLSCFLREEQPGKINVSLRSVGSFACNAVAERFFNGGGHKNASGGELRCSMDEAVNRFMQALEAFDEALTCK